MGDLNAQQLLAENNKLKHERSELSSVLGEEKAMVKYLHGVIKNYEHLLRTNSKKVNRYRPAVAHRNITELETNRDLISSTIRVKSPNKTSSEMVPVQMDEKTNSEANSMASQSCGVSRSMMECRDMLGLQTGKQEVKQQNNIHNEGFCTLYDDVYLEDLECSVCSSSNGESTDDSLVSPEMERKKFHEGMQLSRSEQHSKVSSQTLKGIYWNVSSQTFDGMSHCKGHQSDKNQNEYYWKTSSQTSDCISPRERIRIDKNQNEKEWKTSSQTCDRDGIPSRERIRTDKNQNEKEWKTSSQTFDRDGIPSRERIRSDKNQNEKEWKTSSRSQTFDGISPRERIRSDKNQVENNQWKTSSQTFDRISSRGGHDKPSPQSQRVKSTYLDGKMSYVEYRDCNQKVVVPQPYKQSTAPHKGDKQAVKDKEIDELNKELDRITSQLNKYEKSLTRSERHLDKMEHRMEYLESFALGEESEYL